MARSSECTGSCARKVLDTADIVRDAILHLSDPGRQAWVAIRKPAQAPEGRHYTNFSAFATSDTPSTISARCSPFTIEP
jgi:hypothetical protein